MAIVVPEPGRLLEQWAEKYKERYRWRLRSSFQTANPFGTELASIIGGLDRLVPGMYAFSSAMAASAESPFVDIDVVDVFLLPSKAEASPRKLKSESNRGPLLRQTARCVRIHLASGWPFRSLFQTVVQLGDTS